MHLKMSSAEVVCCIYLLIFLTNIHIQANIVDLEQSELGPQCLYLEEDFRRFQPMTKADDR